ncbi:kinase-like domain-containing protein [Lyophyllum atratum]|nr:kinase-like domain-containing protein [Lyophyllum atratum]
MDPAATVCQKCCSRKPGLSVPELQAVNSKRQCAGCSLTSERITAALCVACIGYYRTQENVPREIFSLPGVLSLISGAVDTEAERTLGELRGNADDNDNFNLASAIVSRAAQHRARASDTRLNTGPPKTIRNTSSNNNFNNLTRANELKLERRQKKVEAKLRDEQRGITIIASLWAHDQKSKLVEVRPAVHVRRTFHEGEEVKSSLDDLLKQARCDFQITTPQADELTWENIRLLADCGGTNEWSSLSHLDKNGTVKDMFEEFRKHKYASEANLKASTIKIRFEIIGDPGDSSDPLFSKSLQSSVTSSKKSLKRPRADSTIPSVTASSKRDLRSKAPASAASSGVNTLHEDRSPVPIVLKSAFKPRQSAMLPPPLPPLRQTWSRNPPMQEYNFIRTAATVEDDGTVVFSQSKELEVIELATDWERGEEASRRKETYGDTGYIGRGATKRAIYARFGKREYVLTQNFDEQTTAEEVKKNLTGEYELLALCHWFKAKFDEHAANQGSTTIPKFYFNFPASIMGRLERLKSGSTHVPFFDFIATPLLPCGPVDAKVKKFTGNEHFGEASDDMTQAVHAFVHFSAVYSDNSILFCDLQGTLDLKGVMCLFDPQAHTNSDVPSHYWDLGSKLFGRIMAQHSQVCSKNWVCQRLSLGNLRVERLFSRAQSVAPGGTVNSHQPSAQQNARIPTGMRSILNSSSNSRDV